VTPAAAAVGPALEFILANTRLAAPPLLPEIRLHLAAEPIGLWELAEREAGGPSLPVPFWGFPWAGGIALARYLLDHPDQVSGRSVLDVAAGSGLVAIAAARAGAAAVTANEIDPLAVAAIAMNAAANGVTLGVVPADLLDGDGGGADLVLVGDACYERQLARRILAFLARATSAGARVLIGDPGRSYLPQADLVALGGYDVPAWPGLEDEPVKHTMIWRPAGPAGGGARSRRRAG
jgi:predicted nicotinamide N-methyase